MRKFLTIILLTLAICFLICGCTTSTAKESDITKFSNKLCLAMDNNIDYMSLMIRYAGIGDIDALKATIIARNAKIVSQNLNYEQITLEHFIDNYEQYAGFSLVEDYIELMKDCCMNGDIVAGRKVEAKRNLKIDTLGLNTKKISFDELLELSKIITAEAGSSWLSVEWKMMVGEIVLNRVASVEFPNTIEEVIHQKGQYSNANTKWFSNMTPFGDCVDAAIRLLDGERIINDSSVVFQSGNKQGSGVHLALYDSYYGYTYLCYSSHPELYK